MSSSRRKRREKSVFVYTVSLEDREFVVLVGLVSFGSLSGLEEWNTSLFGQPFSLFF